MVSFTKVSPITITGNQCPSAAALHCTSPWWSQGPTAMGCIEHHGSRAGWLHMHVPHHCRQTTESQGFSMSQSSPLNQSSSSTVGGNYNL